MKERELASIFKKSCAIDNHMYVDIPDSASMAASPCDGILCYQGNFVAIEFKRLVGYKAFNPKTLREGQVRGLDAVIESGGTAIVGLMIWQSRTYNRLHWWEWNEFKRITDNLTKSIKINVYKDSEFCECTKKKYNLEKFYNSLDLHISL